MARLNFNAHKGNIGFNAFFNGNDQLQSNTLLSYTRQSYNNAKDTIDKLYQNGTTPFTRNSYQSGLSLDWRMTPTDELTATLGIDHGGKHTNGNIAQQEQIVTGGTVFSNLLSQKNHHQPIQRKPPRTGASPTKIF